MGTRWPRLRGLLLFGAVLSVGQTWTLGLAAAMIAGGTMWGTWKLMCAKSPEAVTLLNERVVHPLLAISASLLVVLTLDTAVTTRAMSLQTPRTIPTAPYVDFVINDLNRRVADLEGTTKGQAVDVGKMDVRMALVEASVSDLKSMMAKAIMWLEGVAGFLLCQFLYPYVWKTKKAAEKALDG